MWNRTALSCTFILVFSQLNLPLKASTNKTRQNISFNNRILARFSRHFGIKDKHNENISNENNYFFSLDVSILFSLLYHINNNLHLGRISA